MSDVAVSKRALSDVTVVVTSFNHQAYVERCLDSLAAQSSPAQQIIVIDDCSRDDSANVIEHWLAQSGETYAFIRHERNLGVCASLNEALSQAKGRYFCHVSADDWEESARFELQTAAFEGADSNTSMLVSNIREVDAGGLTIIDHDFGKRLRLMTGPHGQLQLLHRLLAENVIPAPGVLMRTDLIREVGGYDESLAFEDYDMWLRLSTRYSIAYEPSIVANYRVLNSSLMRNHARRVSVLRSEGDMLSKHSGRTSEVDAIIAQRLIHIASELLEFGDATALRHVLSAALSLSHEPWLRRAQITTHLPGGIAHLRNTRSKEFGLPETVTVARVGGGKHGPSS